MIVGMTDRNRVHVALIARDTVMRSCDVLRCVPIEPRRHLFSETTKASPKRMMLRVNAVIESHVLYSRYQT